MDREQKILLIRSAKRINKAINTEALYLELDNIQKWISRQPTDVEIARKLANECVREYNQRDREGTHVPNINYFYQYLNKLEKL